MKKLERGGLENSKYKKIEAARSDQLAEKVFKRYINSFALRHLYKRHNKKILEIIKKNKKQKSNLLDIGCGFGDFLIDAAGEVDYIYGIDLGEENISLALKNTAGHKNIKLTLADAEHLPFEDNFFDYIVMKGIIHHLGSPNQAFNEVKRVLKKEGLFIIFEGNPNSIYRKIILGIADLFKVEHESSLFFHLSPSKIKNLLTDNKFRVDVKNISGFFTPIGLRGLGNEFLWKIFDGLEDFFENRLPLFGWYALLTAKNKE